MVHVLGESRTHEKAEKNGEEQAHIKANVMNPRIASLGQPGWLHLGLVSPLPIEFIGSFPSLAKAPPARLPEFAFVGRSNVGKSSLINALSRKAGLAKTSSTPGKTQLINLFQVEDRWTLVDLPGYGYAKLSKKHRASLHTMIRTYLEGRESLFCALLLLDAKIPLQTIDEQMIEWMAERGIPQAWVFTKVDKGRARETNKQLRTNIIELSKSWEQPPPIFKTSSAKGIGRDEVLNFIEDSLAAQSQLLSS